jgi:hypothetical protein
MSRGSENEARFEIKIPADSIEAQIRVDKVAAADVSGESYATYTATLETHEGRVIWRQANLRARKSGGSVSLKIPAAKLSNGDYALSLYGITAGGDESRVGDCQLNVSKTK